MGVGPSHAKTPMPSAAGELNDSMGTTFRPTARDASTNCVGKPHSASINCESGWQAQELIVLASDG